MANLKFQEGAEDFQQAEWLTLLIDRTWRYDREWSKRRDVMLGPRSRDCVLRGPPFGLKPPMKPYVILWGSQTGRAATRRVGRDWLSAMFKPSMMAIRAVATSKGFASLI